MMCAVANCALKVHSRGFCMRHYTRLVRGGDPHTPSQQERTREERFFQFCTPGDGCWEWTGARQPDGRYDYGMFWDGTRAVRAHRFAYELLVGPIPVGLELDHLCRNPPCVNPAHLEPVTHAENIRRGVWRPRMKSSTKA